MKAEENSTIRGERSFFRKEARQGTLIRMSAIFGAKWNLPILYQLSVNRTMYFSDLKKQIAGISAKMLSESLDRLESRYGLVKREALEDRPRRVSYSLTEAGESFEPILLSIVEWGRENISTDVN